MLYYPHSECFFSPQLNHSGNNFINTKRQLCFHEDSDTRQAENEDQLSKHTHKKMDLKKLYIYICICTVVKTSKLLSDLTTPMFLCSMVQDVLHGTAQQETSK